MLFGTWRCCGAGGGTNGPCCWGIWTPGGGNATCAGGGWEKWGGGTPTIGGGAVNCVTVKCKFNYFT